jgi:hypothetical protein
MDFIGMAADTNSLANLLKSAWIENSHRKKQVSDWMRKLTYATSGLNVDATRAAFKVGYESPT